MLAVEEVRSHLRSESPWTVHALGQVTSTMEVARTAAEEGAAGFTAVIADSQTAGTGRHDRPWASSSDAGLWMTALLRPALAPDRAPWFTLATAVAVAEALRGLGFPAAIKWPNDVLVAEGPLFRRKLCGIRAEMDVDDAGRLAWVSLGIGLNVSQGSFEGPLVSVAASLAMLREGEPPSRARCAAAILDGVEDVCRSLEAEGFSAVRRRWLALALGLDEEAAVRDIDGEQRGIVRGMDDEGHLLLERPGDCEPYPIVAGDLVFSARELSGAR